MPTGRSGAARRSIAVGQTALLSAADIKEINTNLSPVLKNGQRENAFDIPPLSCGRCYQLAAQGRFPLAYASGDDVDLTHRYDLFLHQDNDLIVLALHPDGHVVDRGEFLGCKHLFNRSTFHQMPVVH